MPTTASGETNGDGGVTSCIGFTFTCSRAGPGCASQAWTDPSSSPAFETKCPQRPTAFATSPKLGFLKSVYTGTKARQQSVQSRPDVANRSDRNRMSSPDMRGIEVDLDDLRAVRIELRPGEIRSEE